MFNDLSSLDTYLQSRRSGRPRDMVSPGPERAELQTILETAIRVPDHGKLAPWRLVIVQKDQREALAERLKRAYLKETPNAGRAEIEAMELFASHAPCLVVALSSPATNSKIPLWEQQLSCGAMCMNMLHAVHSKGYVGSWITGWPAFNDDVRDSFGTSDETIAGFFFIGSASKPLEERKRPDSAQIISEWDI